MLSLLRKNAKIIKKVESKKYQTDYLLIKNQPLSKYAE